MEKFKKYVNEKIWKKIPSSDICVNSQYTTNNNRLRFKRTRIIGNNNNIVGGYGCIIIGDNNIIRAHYCVVKGKFNHVYGSNCIIQEEGNFVYGSNCYDEVAGNWIESISRSPFLKLMTAEASHEKLKSQYCDDDVDIHQRHTQVNDCNKEHCRIHGKTKSRQSINIDGNTWIIPVPVERDRRLMFMGNYHDVAEQVRLRNGLDQLNFNFDDIVRTSETLLKESKLNTFGCTNQGNLEGKDEETENESEQCRMCFMNKKNVVMGCGHMILCISCTKQVLISKNPACPTCRKKILNATRIFS